MGVMLAEPDFHTRCFVEWEPYPRQVLIAAQRAGYFAPAPIWDDVTTFDGRPFRGAIDTVLAGYPCQPFSQAGQRKGADDERHLWPDVARIIREIQPEWVFLENVAGHVSLGLETVLRELWKMGFTPAAGLFSASETGAPHERLRVFIVAHSDSRDGDGSGRFRARRRAESANSSVDVADAGSGRHGGSGEGQIQQSRRSEIVGAGDDVGNAEIIGRGARRTKPEVRSGRNSPASAGGTVADRLSPGLEGQQPGQRDPCGRKEPHGLAGLSRRAWVHPPGPADMGRWADVLVTSPDLAPSASFGDLASFAGQVAAMAQAGLVAEAEIEPALRRMADGLALRSRALRLLGNGVHPLAAGHAWRTLATAHGLGALDLATADAHLRAAAI